MTDLTGVEGRPDPFREWLSLYMRICVTGSRDWVWADDIVRVLRQVHDMTPDWPRLLISGGATGADTNAEMSARYLGWDTLVIHPNWKHHGKKAGFLRNRSLIRCKPHVVLAFIKDDSPGATMTAQLAEAEGIPVWYVRRNKPRTLRGWIEDASTGATRSEPADLTAITRSLARSA